MTGDRRCRIRPQLFGFRSNPLGEYVQMNTLIQARIRMEKLPVLSCRVGVRLSSEDGERVGVVGGTGWPNANSAISVQRRRFDSAFGTAR